MTAADTSCTSCIERDEKNQRPDEAAIFVPRLNMSLCELCRRDRGVTLIPDVDDVYDDISDQDYHADPDSLSSSGARTLLWSTPAKYLEERQTPPNPKPEYDFGHAAHKFVLGKGADIVTVDADSWRTDKAKAMREDAWREGKIPLLAKDVEKARVMADRVRSHPVVAKLLAKGDAEVTGYWRDPATGVRLRWRADWLCPGQTRLVIVDYKTTKDASVRGFHKSVADYHYHQQDAWYRDGVIANGLCDDPLFVFIAQEKTPPFLATVHECRPHQLERGRALNRMAIDLYAQCRVTNVWPGYPEDVHPVNFPTWVDYREEAMLKPPAAEQHQKG